MQGCEVCHAAGVVPGTTAAQARALLPPRSEVIQREHEPEHDRAALRRLAQWAIRFTPVVAVDDPDGLLLDITGCESLYHGEDQLRERVWKAVTALGIRCHVATGPTPGSAWAFAHYSRRPVTDVRADDLRDRLADLPIQALRLEESTCAALQEVAIDRIGDLLSLPRCDVACRFGADLLLRLDQALGQAVEYIEPIRPADPVEVEYRLAGPTTQIESIVSLARELLGQLCALLEKRESGAQAVTLRLERSRDAPIILAITLTRPNRCPRHVWSLLAHRLENANLGDGVDSILLTVVRRRRVPHAQVAMASASGREPWDDCPHERDGVDEFVDVLAARLGAGSVLYADLVESHIPARAFIYHAAAATSAARPRIRPERGAQPDRPPCLLASPEPIDVIALTPDGPPVRMRWRGADHVVHACQGPERIACEWWRAEAHAFRTSAAMLADCDYFKILLTDGRCLWVRRESVRGAWSLVGAWT